MRTKLLIIVLVLLVLSLFNSVVVAEPLSTQDNDDRDLVTVKGTATLIYKGYSSITDLGNRRVTIYGYTDTFNKVEYICARIYLQRWNGSTWVSINSKLYYSFNHRFAEGFKGINVVPGYYRAHTIHYAENNGVSHTIYTTSPHKYIN